MAKKHLRFISRIADGHRLPTLRLAAAAVATVGLGGLGWLGWRARRQQQARRSVGTDEVSLEACLAAHRAKVERIAAQLQQHKSGRPVSLRKKAVSHEVPKARDRRHHDERIEVGDLNAILTIDAEKRICIAESGVTFVDLIEATLRHGLVPLVVPELKTITIGGAVSGCSIESMSYKYGGFHDSCLEYEVITARGEILTCTPDNENRLLFQMMHGAFGTLGIISKLTFRLVPAKPFVRVQYEKYDTLAAYQAAIWRRFEARDVDFMDGIIHSPREYVLSVGNFVDVAPYTNRYDWMKIYYQSTRTRSEDYLRTPDYFFRYDRGVTNVHPKSLLGRLFLGKLMSSARLLRLAQKFRFLLSSERPTMTLDVFIPFSRTADFLSWYEKELNFFPLWCVPYRRVRDYEWLDRSFYAGLGDQLFLDLAIYGMKQRGDRNYYREIEEELRRVGGVKTLISHNYYSEREFWSIWNRENYFQVKQRTDPDNIFRDLYAKTCLAAQGRDEAPAPGVAPGG